MTTAHVIVDPRRNLVQPGPAVLIGQWLSIGHLRHVGGWMQIIALPQIPTQPLGQCGGHLGLAGSRNPHHHEDDRRLVDHA
jgi:hypothetical protein